MAKATQAKGHCYLCGHQTTKGFMSRHLLTEHYKEEEAQACYLLKIEGYDVNGYWLFVDMPLTSTLSTLDGFLRSIWLECCGHMSMFFLPPMDEISMSTKVGRISKGTVLLYMYDFGSSTELKITFVGTVSRKKQRESVRLLARNDPHIFPCDICGEPAEYVEVDSWEGGFYCQACVDKEDSEIDPDMLLPITNSPRMGVCAYCGEMDNFGYVPGRLKK